ncbi:hypothetical protein Micbo1qcDRAFT_175624 [Microdochium bolleyi]|uniref:Uncharacterized protein n=1 Tax=Microdochium bolleyi TaxID=196109 RepID=A0A136J2T7_9PEZI|nr:hypothetical protein Micbo1qcDRAFT_175624 [Microdochium bolleyi]
MDYNKKVPIPRLRRQGGAHLQEKGFLEPREPSIKGGAGSFKSFLKNSKVLPPQDFGTLTRVYQLPKGGRSGSGKKKPDTNVFVRRDRGTAKYNIWRGECDRYEDRKFNVLKFPLESNKNHWAYGKGRTMNDLDDLGLSMLRIAQWPYCPSIKTKAPFLWVLEEEFTLPAVELSHPLEKVISTPELFEMVLADLAMFNAISSHFARINTRDSEYKSLCFLPPGHVNISDAVKVDAETFTTLNVGPFLIVGGIRGSWLKGHEPEIDIDYTTECGVWEYPSRVKYRGQGAKKTMQGYLEFLQCIEQRPTVLRHVLLQGLMFLDLHGVRAIVRSSPALATLAIHNCELLHFGAVKGLVQLIKDENDCRQREKKTSLVLDFYPRYYQGPRTGSQGCYGVVWSDEGFVDTIRAVTAVLITLIPLARQAGVDLLRPGKAFRLWLDKLPFRHRTLPHILDAILRLIDLDATQIEKTSSTERDVLLMTAWVDIIIALNGQSMSENALEKIMSPREVGRSWLLNCSCCEGLFPSIIFKADIVDRDDHTRICHGCQLLAYLNGTAHNYNSLNMKVQAAAYLWNDGEIDDICKLYNPQPEDTAENGEPSRIVEARLAACDIAQRRAVGIPQELAQAETALEALNSQEVNRSFGSNADTDKRDQVETWCQSLRAELGTGQISPGTAAQPRPPAAASWQENIRWYMATADEEAGRLQISGPYAGVVTKASARKQIFW